MQDTIKEKWLQEYAGWRYGWRNVGVIRGKGFIELIISDGPLDNLVAVTKTERGEQVLDVTDEQLAEAGLLKIRIERMAAASSPSFDLDQEF